MKTFSFLTLACLLVTGSYAMAQVKKGDPAAPHPASNVSVAAVNMTEGEVRKVDMASKKIILKHGEIKNLGMGAMTMVFQVKDAALLEKVKAGDKVKFTAEKVDGAIVVTGIERSK